jgi:hypothetical protein
MDPELEQLTRLLHAVVAKINARKEATQVHVFEMPAIEGGAVGAAMWFPKPGVPAHAAPPYTVVSRENSVVQPAPCRKFEALLNANRAMIADVKAHASNLLICTFDAPAAEGGLARTQFHISQWPSREAAGKWHRESKEHAEVVRLIRDQPTVRFEPSLLASYEVVKSKVPHRCPVCGELAYGRTGPEPRCAKCLTDPGA